MLTWDPLKFDIVIGPHKVVGTAPDNFITASFNEDQWTIQIGADGLPCRTRNANRSGRFTVTTMRGSPSNTFLAALARFDYGNAAGAVPVLIKDKNNLTGVAQASCEQGWIIKMADMGRGKETDTQEWIIETGVMDINPAGFSDITQLVPNIPQPG